MGRCRSMQYVVQKSVGSGSVPQAAARISGSMVWESSGNIICEMRERTTNNVLAMFKTRVVIYSESQTRHTIRTMSHVRQRVFGLCRRSTRISLPASQIRHASSDPHSHHEDTNIYPEESGSLLYSSPFLSFISCIGFNTPFWRNTVIFTLLGFGIYNFAPYVDKDGTYITRYIQHYKTPNEVWTRINNKHLELSVDAAQSRLLIGSAMRPHILRMRSPS